MLSSKLRLAIKKRWAKDTLTFFRKVDNSTKSSTGELNGIPKTEHLRTIPTFANQVAGKVGVENAKDELVDVFGDEEKWLPIGQNDRVKNDRNTGVCFTETMKDRNKAADLLKLGFGIWC